MTTLKREVDGLKKDLKGICAISAVFILLFVIQQPATFTGAATHPQFNKYSPLYHFLDTIKIQTVNPAATCTVCPWAT